MYYVMSSVYNFHCMADIICCDGMGEMNPMVRCILDAPLEGVVSIGILLLLGLRHAFSHLYEVPILGAYHIYSWSGFLFSVEDHVILIPSRESLLLVDESEPLSR